MYSSQYLDQQQQVHLNVGTGLKSPIPRIIINDPTNQTMNHNSESSKEKTFFENFSRSVSLRQKYLKQFFHTRRTRKRFSDSFLSQQQPPNTTNVDLNHDQERNLSIHRRSFYLPNLPTIHQTIPTETLSKTSEHSQKLFIIRHGERVDSTFGTNWLHQVFDPNTGVYHRTNLNLPKKMVTRKDYRDFVFDPPLTELGLYQCKLVGEELAAQGIKIDHVYSSPTLRCIQTADQILQGLDKREKIPIRIEPCLFEFLKWYPVLPSTWPFLSNEELIGNGYHIDQSYKPFYPIESLRKDEDELMFYSRSHFITTSILKNHEDQQGNILIIGHVRFLLGNLLRKTFVFSGINNRSLFSTINRWSTANSRFEITCLTCSFPCHSLCWQTKRWNMESN